MNFFKSNTHKNQYQLVAREDEDDEINESTNLLPPINTNEGASLPQNSQIYFADPNNKYTTYSPFLREKLSIYNLYAMQHSTTGYKPLKNDKNKARTDNLFRVDSVKQTTLNTFHSSYPIIVAPENTTDLSANKPVAVIDCFTINDNQFGNLLRHPNSDKLLQISTRSNNGWVNIDEDTARNMALDKSKRHVYACPLVEKLIESKYENILLDPVNNLKPVQTRRVITEEKHYHSHLGASYCEIDSEPLVIKIIFDPIKLEKTGKNAEQATKEITKYLCSSQAAKDCEDLGNQEAMQRNSSINAAVTRSDSSISNPSIQPLAADASSNLPTAESNRRPHHLPPLQPAVKYPRKNNISPSNQKPNQEFNDANDFSRL